LFFGVAIEAADMFTIHYRDFTKVEDAVGYQAFYQITRIIEHFVPRKGIKASINAIGQQLVKKGDAIIRGMFTTFLLVHSNRFNRVKLSEETFANDGTNLFEGSCGVLIQDGGGRCDKEFSHG
jgi:hypothetical protein